MLIKNPWLNVTNSTHRTQLISGVFFFLFINLKRSQNYHTIRFGFLSLRIVLTANLLFFLFYSELLYVLCICIHICHSQIMILQFKYLLLLLF